MAILENTRCRYKREDIQNAHNRIADLRARGREAMTFDDRMASGGDWEAGRDWLIDQAEKSIAYAEKKLETCEKAREKPRKPWTARAAAKERIPAGRIVLISILTTLKDV